MTAPDSDAARDAVLRFAEAILHGDPVHRQWLNDAAAAFLAGDPMPPPRSAPAADSGRDAEIARLREEIEAQTIERCAVIADGGARLADSAADVRFVTPAKYAGDLARDIAGAIRAIAKPGGQQP